jgi:hypothetical protein
MRNLTVLASLLVALLAACTSATSPPNGGTQPPPGGGDNVSTFWLPFSTQDDGVVHTYGTTVAVDGAGGIHVTYAVYIGDDAGTRPAYYAYCPGSCANESSWTRIRLGDAVQDARLALDPAGRPRIMLYTTVPDPGGVWPEYAKQYRYAACDSSCTNSANWTITIVATAEEIPVGRADYMFHYFALDPQGNPRFIYTDTRGYMNHSGTYYMYCDTACTTASSWTEVDLELGYVIDQPELAFTPAGEPRLALKVYLDDPDGIDSTAWIAYIECDATCQTWSGLLLFENIHGTASFRLRLDSQGRPRLAYYSGNYADPPHEPSQLYYYWCNTACTNPDTNPEPNDWDGYPLGYPNYHGEGVDLILDQADRPHLAYQAFIEGLGYAWCTVNCESGNPSWQSGVVESNNTLDAHFPVPPIRSCTISTWSAGARPSLALDSAGRPRIGYDVEHGWTGWDEANNRPCDLFTDIRLARFALFNQ